MIIYNYKSITVILMYPAYSIIFQYCNFQSITTANIKGHFYMLKFLSSVSTLTRDFDIANLSVCLSVSPSMTFRYQMKTA